MTRTLQSELDKIMPKPRYCDTHCINCSKEIPEFSLVCGDCERKHRESERLAAEELHCVRCHNVTRNRPEIWCDDCIKNQEE